MSSFTSNSKSRFFAFLIPTTLLLLVCYHLLIPKVSHIPVEYQNQNQDNAIKTENFIFTEMPSEVLVVGSSLSARLDHDFTVQGGYNLAMGSDSALTGLELLKRSRRKPKIVIIEGNVLLPVNKVLISSVMGEPNYFLKSMSPIFREQYQPVTVFNSYLKSFFSRSIKAFNEEGFKIGLAEQKRSNQTLRENHKEDLKKRFSEVDEYLKYLKGEGIKVLFVYMPMHIDVYNSPVATYQREELLQFLSARGLNCILPNSLEYKTTDGIHLDSTALPRFSRYLESEVAKIDL